MLFALIQFNNIFLYIIYTQLTTITVKSLKVGLPSVEAYFRLRLTQTTCGPWGLFAKGQRRLRRLYGWNLPGTWTWRKLDMAQPLSLKPLNVWTCAPDSNGLELTICELMWIAELLLFIGVCQWAQTVKPCETAFFRTPPAISCLASARLSGRRASWDPSIDCRILRKWIQNDPKIIKDPLWHVPWWSSSIQSRLSMTAPWGVTMGVIMGHPSGHPDLKTWHCRWEIASQAWNSLMGHESQMEFVGVDGTGISWIWVNFMVNYNDLTGMMVSNWNHP